MRDKVRTKKEAAMLVAGTGFEIAHIVFAVIGFFIMTAGIFSKSSWGCTLALCGFLMLAFGLWGVIASVVIVVILLIITAFIPP